MDAKELETAIEAPSASLLALDEALQRLEADEPRMAEIVRLRFFAGLTEQETATAMEVSERTVRRTCRGSSAPSSSIASAAPTGACAAKWRNSCAAKTKPPRRSCAVRSILRMSPISIPPCAATGGGGARRRQYRARPHVRSEPQPPGREADLARVPPRARIAARLLGGVGVLLAQSVSRQQGPARRRDLRSRPGPGRRAGGRRRFARTRSSLGGGLRAVASHLVGARGASGALAFSAGGWTFQGVAFSPDGSLLGAAFPGHVFRLLRVEDGSEVARIPTGDVQTLSIQFSHDGSTLAVVARNGSVELWNLAGEHLASLATPGGTAPWTVDFRADGAKLATGLWNGKVVVFDLASRCVDQILEGHQGTVWSVSFVPGNEDLLASCAADGTVKLWSLSLARNVATLEGLAGDAITVGVGPRGQRLVAAGGGTPCPTLRPWSQESARMSAMSAPNRSFPPGTDERHGCCRQMRRRCRGFMSNPGRI